MSTLSLSAVLLILAATVAGCGQDATPNIDALAAKGLMLTQFHVSPNCGPTRGALMKGLDPHRAGMGGICPSEWRRQSLADQGAHNPLHVPQEYIDKYHGRFDDGWA